MFSAFLKNVGGELADCNRRGARLPPLADFAALVPIKGQSGGLAGLDPEEARTKSWGLESCQRDESHARVVVCAGDESCEPDEALSRWEASPQENHRFFNAAKTYGMETWLLCANILNNQPAAWPRHQPRGSTCTTRLPRLRIQI
jgi:hypothetical protein